MKKIYFSHEQMLEVKRARDREFYAANRARLNADRREKRGAPIRGRYQIIHDVQETPVRPPPEVLMERDYRAELMKYLSPSSVHFGDPPTIYAACYPGKAIKQQLAFAMGVDK